MAGIFNKSGPRKTDEVAETGARSPVAPHGAGGASSDVTREGRQPGGDVAAFVQQVRALGAVAPRPTAGTRGRLLFAMDATMSRQPMWDLALGLQADMFAEVDRIGGLDVQLIFYRGVGECKTSPWVSKPNDLARLMSSVSCRGGRTQIARVLRHARDETKRERIGALVFVGDAMEENIDEVADVAGELGLLGLKGFFFQEGWDPNTRIAFKEFARLTGGAYARFDSGAAAQLRALLSAVAVYAAGGHGALNQISASNAPARALLEQLDT